MHSLSLSFTFHSLTKPSFLSISSSPLSLSLPFHPLHSTHKCSAKSRPDSNNEERVEQKEDLTDIITRLVEKSGINARERRLIKVREAKRQREHDRARNYPEWARLLENGCKEDEELRAILGDTIGKPDLMKKRIEERVIKKGKDFRKKETGSVVAFDVSFRDFNPLSSYIWIELYGEATERDVDLLGTAIQSWYVMGRLGAYNSSNLQLIDDPMSHNPLYDSEKATKVIPSSFHDISDVEFQDNMARVWVDLGTTDFFALDVLLNCLTVLSSEHLGIKQVVFGGKIIGDWEEGMTNPEFGYRSFQI
ncbi:hypothetical protein LUZ60_006978 [Juncus effusus]|nr:hypothetical protein LUZ60_006978 [Juncus effusus]